MSATFSDNVIRPVSLSRRVLQIKIYELLFSLPQLSVSLSHLSTTIFHKTPFSNNPILFPMRKRPFFLPTSLFFTFDCRCISITPSQFPHNNIVLQMVNLYRAISQINSSIWTRISQQYQVPAYR